VRALIISDHLEEPGTRDKYRALAAAGVNVLVATPGGPATVDAHVRYAPIPVRGPEDEPGARRWHLPSLRKVFSEHRPELLHLETDPESTVAASASMVARKSACPYTVFNWRPLAPSLGLWARRRSATVLRHASGVAGGSPLAMELLRADAPTAIAAHFPQAGIELPPARTVQTGAGLTLGFAGRLVPERGADLLIRALGQTFGNWQLLVAGTGPEQEVLEDMVQRLGLASRIRWLGGLRAEALAEVFRDADCLVVSSRDTPTWVEYHSPVLLEAMGRGMAPIVTRAGCLPSLVGDAGVVVDDAEQLTTILQSWVADPSLCRALGGRARQRVLDRFVTTAVAEQTLTFWRAVVEHSATSGPR
jgi:glycosyltransferase involved in cell wall biosynthesis